jgi:hypothetical protein
MSEDVGGPFYTVPWSPGMQRQQMPGVLWKQLVARAEQLRSLDASVGVLRKAITMRTMEGVFFGSPLDQLAAYLGMISAPGLRKTKAEPEGERIAV